MIREACPRYGDFDRFAAVTGPDLSVGEQASVIRLALEVLEVQHRPGRTLTDPNATRDYLRLRLGSHEREVFGALFLDSRNRLRKDEVLFRGTLEGASIHPRIVVQHALAANAGAAIFYHNHPSGIPEPSRADRAITRRLRDALALVDVRVLDHLVVGSEGTVSFAERGLL